MLPSECDTELPKEEFDAKARAREFTVGPFQEDATGEYGAPYIARKHFRVFGQLRDERKVWAWRYPGER